MFPTSQGRRGCLQRIAGAVVQAAIHFEALDNALAAERHDVPVLHLREVADLPLYLHGEVVVQTELPSEIATSTSGRSICLG